MSFDPKIFDTLLEPVFVLNRDAKILYCNEPAAAICESSVRKLMRGQFFTSVLKFEKPPEFLNSIVLIKDPTPYQELGFSSPSGKIGKAQITAQLFDPMAENWIVFFRDVTLEETLQKKYRAELETVQKYSQNLERMVDERTAEVKKLNRTMAALLDSLNQGFLIFDAEGTCLEVYSKACERVLETLPNGKKIWDVLRLPSSEVEGFRKWIRTIYAELLPFEDLAPLGPVDFKHSENRNVKLEYYQIKNTNGAVEGVVMVATDVTSLVQAQQQAEVDRAQSKMILNLIRNKRHVASFIRDTRGLLTTLEIEIERGPQIDIESAYRAVHTIKGGAATFSIKPMTDLCHEIETHLSSFKWEGAGDNQIKKLYDLNYKLEEAYLTFQINNMDVIGAESQLQERMIEGPVSRFLEFQSRYLNRNPILSHLYTENIIMEPISQYFMRYNEVTKNVAENLSKEIKPVEWIGADIRILPEVYEQLFSSFVHAFRNAIDHGIESADERSALGKDRAGSIVVRFSKTLSDGCENLLIEISDDGSGISPEKIRQKLSKLGVDVAGESDEQIIQHVFDSQFTTKDQVSETSGRGVGMDAISFAANELGGKAWVKSTTGKGTKLFVQVPLYYRMADLKKPENPQVA